MWEAADLGEAIVVIVVPEERKVPPYFVGVTQNWKNVSKLWSGLSYILKVCQSFNNFDMNVMQWKLLTKFNLKNII